MSDRLAELVRQRALVREHLAWLEREIERAGGKSAETIVAATSPSPASVPSVAVTARVPSRASEAAAPNPDEIIEKYRTSPAAVESEVRKGCFLYFAVALVLLAAVVAVLYVTIGSR